MAHPRHELTLGFVGALGRFLRLLQVHLVGHRLGDVTRDEYGTSRVPIRVTNQSPSRLDVQHSPVDVLRSEPVTGEVPVATFEEAVQL